MKKIFIFAIFCLSFFLLLPNNVVNAANDGTTAVGALDSYTGVSVDPGVSTNASGQTATLGGLDFRCWKLSDCNKRREALGISKDKAEQMGIYQGLDAVKACGGKETPDKSDKVGFCTAITNTETRTSFAGKSNFTGILDFIQYIYQYAVVIGGVLALVMLIIAGFQWTISGGNSEQKQSAQKRISGAFMGLLILFLSYTVLNTISPYLVNLRAPQTWLINTVSLAPRYCKDLNAPALVALAYGQSEMVSKEILDTKFRSVMAYDVDPVVGTVCGDNYFVENGSGMTCMGTYCGASISSNPSSTLSNTGPNKTCYKRSENESYQCMPGNIMGKITNSDIKANVPGSDFIPGRDSFIWPWIIDIYKDIRLIYICKDGEKGGAGNGNVIILDEEKQIQYYWVSLDNLDVVDECKDNGGFKGFVLSMQFRENMVVGLTVEGEKHYIGKNGLEPIDLGDEGVLGVFGAFDTVKITAPSEYFFTTTSLALGLAFDIDAKYICDIDDNFKDRLACYRELGFR